MKKIINWFKNHLPTKRKLIQVYAALLFNANLKGFGNGKIYTGPMKNICTPGMNCYSCPGASGACPLGALQNALASSGARAPYYVFGIIMLYGFLFGRWICGFLCPFGLIQELLHKIPTPKLKKNRFTRVLSNLKFVLLGFFVGIVPLAYAFRNFPLPGFCKYICPSGTLEGAMGLLSNEVNESYLRMLGPLFTWKFLLMVSMVVASVFIFRFFCRFLCPLGALYGLFNKISLIGVTVDKSACTDCGICTNQCKMDVCHVGDRECINCGECIGTCPTKAISWKGSKIFLAPNAIDVPVDVDQAQKEEIIAYNEARTEKIAKRNKIIKIAVGVLMVAVLACTLIYYNFIDGSEAQPDPNPPADETPLPDTPTEGTEVGNLCPEITLDVLNKDSDFSLQANRGKVVVLNFWYTTCGPCVEELPHFNEAATTYGDNVVIMAVHIEFPGMTSAQALDWVQEQHPDWASGNMQIAWDTGKVCQNMFNIQACPVTVVVDTQGVITEKFVGSVTADELNAAIDAAMSGEEQPVIPTGTAVGNLCPQITLDVLNKDGDFSLQANRGKAVVLNFWYTTCGPCVEELPHFNEAATNYGDDVVIMAVHIDFPGMTSAQALEWVQQQHPDWASGNMQIAWDAGKVCQSMFNIQACPVTVVVDTQGVITHIFVGSVTADELNAAIDQALGN